MHNTRRVATTTVNEIFNTDGETGRLIYDVFTKAGACKRNLIFVSGSCLLSSKLLCTCYIYMVSPSSS